MKRYVALLLSMVLMIGCVQGVGATQSYPTNTYKFVITDCTWAEAFQYAQDAGGHLACFESVQELQFVQSMIQAQGLQWKIFWLGARRDTDSYDYHWVDEDNYLEEYDTLNDSSSPMFFQWLEGEPSFEDQGVMECCVDMFYSTTENRFVLNDVPNDMLSVVPSFSGKVGYIIEYDYSYAPPAAGYDWYYSDDYDDSDDYDYSDDYYDSDDYDYSDDYDDSISNLGNGFTYEILTNVPEEYIFTSGVGGWSSELTLFEDGSFMGSYHDSDMGADTENYPGGVCYISSFTGQFSNFRQIDDCTWAMDLTELNYDLEPGTDYEENGIHYLATEAYGLSGGNIFYLYTADHPVDTLPDDFMSWADLYRSEYSYSPVLSIYGIYNEATGCGWGGDW